MHQLAVTLVLGWGELDHLEDVNLYIQNFSARQTWYIQCGHSASEHFKDFVKDINYKDKVKNDANFRRSDKIYASGPYFQNTLLRRHPSQ